MLVRSFIPLVCVLWIVSISPADAPWPQFRGPSGDGIVTDQNVPLEFGEKKNLVWKTSVPGKAWSSPVIADGVIWATTAIEVFPSEDERLTFVTCAPYPHSSQRLIVVALPAKDKGRWTRDERWPHVHY